MTVVKRGKQFCLISKTSGRTLGCHPSQKAAMSQEKAIQLSKLRAKGYNIPKK